MRRRCRQVFLGRCGHSRTLASSVEGVNLTSPDEITQGTTLYRISGRLHILSPRAGPGCHLRGKQRTLRAPCCGAEFGGEKRHRVRR
jgi:hypothetical protein